MAQSQWVDLRGLRCPEPVMMLHGVFRQLTAGGCVKVLATDPTTEHDVPRFCQNLGHVLLQASALESMPEDFLSSNQKDDAAPEQSHECYFFYEIQKAP